MRIIFRRRREDIKELWRVCVRREFLIRSLLLFIKVFEVDFFRTEGSAAAKECSGQHEDVTKRNLQPDGLWRSFF